MAPVADDLSDHERLVRRFTLSYDSSRKVRVTAGGHVRR